MASEMASIERGRGTFERYPLFLAIGIAIIVVSLGLMTWRQANEQVLLSEIFAGRGPTNPSGTYLAAAQLEQALHHIIEQLIFVGLAALKVGIGFSIAVIVLNLRETGRRSLEAFRGAGVVASLPTVRQPWFTKFPKFLIAGFIIVLAFFLLSGIWVYNEYVPFGDQLTTRMTLEAIIKPGKMIGTALLLLGIASGLATIVMNLRMQSHALPKLLVAATRRRTASTSELSVPQGAVPRTLLVPVLLGFAIVISAYMPVAAVLAWNRATNLTSAGWATVSAASLEVILEHWIESYILAGITIILAGIGLWLLEIIRNLRRQREGFLEAYGELSGSTPGVSPHLPRPIAMVRALLAVGLAIVLLALGLTAIWIGAGLEAVSTGAQSAVVADHQWEAFVKPFKFVGLALLFLGVGLALSLIVVHLQMVAMVLPGLFARFSDALRGRSVSPFESPAVDPMKLFPKKLFAGIIAGVVIVITAMIPLSWPLRIETFATFIGANLGTDLVARAALSLERALEHLILPYKLAGLAVIFLTIGRYFTTIVGFVRARKAIVSEGVAAIVANLKTVPSPLTGDQSETVTWEPIDLSKALVVIGFPGLGFVGGIATGYLVESLRLKEIGYVISPVLPPTAVIDGGISASPVRVFLGDVACGPDGSCEQLCVIQSFFAPPPGVTTALAHALVSWVKECGARQLVWFEGVAGDATLGVEPRVTGIASDEAGRQMLERLKIALSPDGLLVGAGAVGVYVARACPSLPFASLRRPARTSPTHGPLRGSLKPFSR